MGGAEQRRLRLFRGTREQGELKEYRVAAGEGMVVLDAVHAIQAEQAPDLAVRWNCKAGKCGSCSAEINGKPRLMCMTRMSDYPADETITVMPMKAFPVIKDLVTDVSWNYQQNKRIKPFTPPQPRPEKGYVMFQEDVDRVQEFRKCIECYLCQDTCHAIRDRDGSIKSPGQAPGGAAFVGPRFMIRLASLEMHPVDTADRIPEVRKEFGSGMCNITRCCTEVCPEHINITDNGIIPLKERVVDRYFDPVAMIGRKLFGIRKRS
ncbi:MAG TPA: succinate dehydrogenase/fumarate reductase iron-sulfur subunit [Kofleriaceae bacterium]